MGVAEKAATGAADAYLNQGVLGATCIIFILLFLGACWVARGLYNDLKACNAAAIAEGKASVKALEAATGAADRQEAAMQGLRATLETRGHAIEELSHQIEKTGQDARHGFANLSQALEAIVRFFVSDRDRGRP